MEENILVVKNNMLTSSKMLNPEPFGIGRICTSFPFVILLEVTKSCSSVGGAS